MTEQERKDIDPVFCAAGLQQILMRKSYDFDYEETACLVGAISLLLDKPYNVWSKEPMLDPPRIIY